MTLADAFKFKAGNGATDADAAAALMFAGLEPTALWADSTDKCKFYGALCDYIMRDRVGITQESEGGYTKVYDKGAKANYVYALAEESGCSALISKYNPQPKVRNKSNLW